MIASAWLGLSLLLCLFVWYAKRQKSVIYMPIVIGLAACVMWVPTGSPRVTKVPPGNYAIVGADIIENVSIGVLLKMAGAPATYYLLPYSKSKAGDVQQAMDDGGVPHMNVGADGDGIVIPAPPPPPKTPETPSITLPAG